MRKGYLCLLTVAMVIALILVAGCTTSNQTNQGASTNTSTSSTTTTASSSTTTSTTITRSPSPSPSRSPSASSSPSPTAATPSPSESRKIATSIQFASVPSVTKGTSLPIDVLVSGIRKCTDGGVVVLGAGGQTIGTVSSGGSGEECQYTAYLDTSSLNPGTYDVTLKFAGDSTYQPSQSTSKITIL